MDEVCNFDPIISEFAIRHHKCQETKAQNHIVLCFVFKLGAY